MSLNESIVEYPALEWFEDLGYAPGEPAAQRRRPEAIFLRGVSCEALARVNLRSGNK